MANEGLKPVGIQLIVENVGPAVAGMTQAAQAEKVLVETVKEVGTTITQVEGGLKANIQSMLEQGATVKQVSQFYQTYGGDINAVNAILKELTATANENTQA